MDKEIKIIIIGIEDLDVYEYVMQMLEKNNELVAAKKFTTDIEEYNEGKYPIYLDLMNLNLAYKNNALLYVTTENNISHGVTIDEYYASDIIDMSIKEFNLVADYTFGENIIICWLDKSKVHDYTKLNLNEIRILENRLQELNYLYFLNTTPDEFANIVNKYLNANDDEKKNLLEEYS